MTEPKKFAFLFNVGTFKFPNWKVHHGNFQYIMLYAI